MAVINITLENLDTEHICCAINEKKGENCVGSKKAWLKERLSDGLVFKKLDARGKVFIEYIPAEFAFAPITAPNYMYINCFWVSGKYKGHGHSNELLLECIEDAKNKGKDGLCILSSDKKRTFLSDPKHLKYKGFKIADTAEPYFRLMYYPFNNDAAVPKFKPQAKTGQIADTGLVLYYSNGCPYTDKYTKILSDHATSRGMKMNVIKLETVEDAQNSPAPFTIYSLYNNGNFITNEILTTNKFDKLIEE